jgi:hypothetical protein
MSTGDRPVSRPLVQSRAYDAMNRTNVPRLGGALAALGSLAT